MAPPAVPPGRSGSGGKRLTPPGRAGGPRDDLESIGGRLSAGETTCLRLTEEYLAQIGRNSDLNAFREVYADEALSHARTVDEKVRSGTAGPLAGMVIALKDVLCLKNHGVSCGSRILENFVAPYDATAVGRLARADAVIIGRTTMDEFAMGSSTEHSAYGPARNPYDPARVPGGSSGGSAVAVAASMATAALGTDTGGSIRQPASLCGVVGLKPTYGRVSRYGLVAFASSFDQIGPIANSVRDCARILGVIAGHDERDATSSKLPVPDYTSGLTGEISGLRIGVPKEYFTGALDREVKGSIEQALDALRARGASVTDVSLPHSDYTIAAYYILSTAEASSNLARYDGARYGKRVAGMGEPGGLDGMYVASRTGGFGEEVKRRIMLGTYVLSAGYYDAYYLKGQKVRRLIQEDFDKAFEKVDCIVTPASPTTAFKFGEKYEDPLQMYLSDVYTVSANLAGIPGISIPCGADSRGLPIGLQVLGRQFDEVTLLRLADAVERWTISQK